MYDDLITLVDVKVLWGAWL